MPADARPIRIDEAANAVSFTVHGPAVLLLRSRDVRLPPGRARIELARGRAGWRVAVGGRVVGRRLVRPEVEVIGGRVTDRLTGAGPVRLLGARLLARSVHAGWLPGRLASRGAWMRGMPAAALWRLSELDRRHRARWRRRATAATLTLRGGEHADTHDVGFVHGETAAYGYDLACSTAASPRGSGCGEMHSSAAAAADRLVTMIRANAPSALLPNHLAPCPDCPSGAREAIIDSLMNIGLLAWAERRAGRPGYARLALLHARAIASPLVRADGCTAQAVFVERVTGRLFGVHTHQGLSAESTWARGQAWALLGFARLARATGDRWARAVSRALAGCWLAKATRGLVRYDLDARAGPPDSSAQAVAAAGFATLALADRASRARWIRAARSQLAVVERLISRRLPLGRLGRQTYVAGGDTFDEDVELPIGQLYVLEARARLRD
jgi:hypothetical protein